MKLDGIRLEKADSDASRSTSRKDRVIINVGGNRHETYLSTLRVVPDSRLAWIGENASKQAEYDPETNELFFDRHPGVFANVLNYYRTGKLHCPGDVCGPLFEEELAFWGIEELQMEPCCWSSYTQHREAQATLKAFEGLQKGNADSDNALGMEAAASRAGMTVKQKVWALLEQPYSSKYAQMIAMVSLAVIVLSVTTFCIESVNFFMVYKYVFVGLEYFYCVWFTTEFVSRFFACPSKVEYFKSVMTWVDLLSVIPLYISLSSTSDLEIDFLFVLRLVRIFRLFRFFRTMSGMQVIGHTLHASARELFLLILILSIPMVIFSTLLYYAEKHYFGKDHSDFHSIPETFWWAVITMTTVGYGDVYPKSPYGKIIGTVCACVGVLIVALPVSVIGSNFTLFYSHAQAQLKLPKKKKKPLLLGAAGALVSDTSLPDIDDDGDEEGDEEQEEEGEGEERIKIRPRLREPRYSVSEFKHLRNPSIHPRCRTSRRQAQGLIDIPVLKSSAIAKAMSENSDVEFPPSTETPLLPMLRSDTSNMSNISSGLKGISDVMLQITAPVTRRMAISPIATPPTRRTSRRRKRKKSPSNGGEESSGYERESFYTTDAESATENQARISELREQMRAQKNQCTSSTSSNFYPHSSKENITSGDENVRSPLSHERCPTDTESNNNAHNNEEMSTNTGQQTPEGYVGTPKETDLTENLERAVSPNKEGTRLGDQIRSTERSPPNIWDRPPDLDTWVKQPAARTKSYNVRKSPDLSRERLWNDSLSPKNENLHSVTFDDTPKEAPPCNGSVNDLRVPGINGRKPCGGSSFGHGGILKDRSQSKSLDRLRMRSPDGCQPEQNDEVILMAGDAPEIERTHCRSNTIV